MPKNEPNFTLKIYAISPKIKLYKAGMELGKKPCLIRAKSLDFEFAFIYTLSHDMLSNKKSLRWRRG